MSLSVGLAWLGWALAACAGAVAACSLRRTRRDHHRLQAARRRFDALIDYAPDAIACVDTRGRILRVNERLLALSGHRACDLVGADVGILVPPRFANHAGHVRDYFARPSIRLMGDGRELTLRQASGDEIPVEIALTHVDDTGGTEVVVAVRDVSARHAARAAVAASEQRLREITDTIPGAVFQFEQEAEGRHRFRFLSRGVHELFELGADAPTPSVETLLAQVLEQDRAGVLGSFATLEGRERWDHEFRIRDAEGQVKWIRASASRASAGADTVWNGMLHDTTETHRLSEELSHQAAHDGLTGLVNRRAFEQRLQQAVTGGGTSRRELVLAYLDLDQFKVINDTCGHAAGDELLRQLAALLARHLRATDILARLGGDEFAAIMQGGGLDTARHVMERIRDVVSDYRFAWEGKTFSVGVSIGLVPIRDGRPGPAEALKCADSACYAAKDAGRNRIHVYEEDDATLATRHGQMRWVPLINEALAERRFELYGQRIVPLGVGAEHEHLEILIRMRLASGELVPPGSFLPAAERYNLAARIDRWVVETVLRDCAGITAPDGTPPMLNINLSGVSLSDPDTTAFIVERLHASALPASRVCFEITETAIISNLAVATDFVARLRALGCRCALDDFGSGLSSFGQLKSLDIDYVKIDGVFVRDLAHDPVDLAMVRAINEMAHAMGVRTVAEFVEDDATLDVLSDIGIDFAQGYAIARPAPVMATTVMAAAPVLAWPAAAGA